MVLAFHSIPGGDAFEGWMAALERMGRRVVPLPRIAAWVRGQGAVEEQAVALTFDDCYRSQFVSAVPALRRRGLPATFYPVTGYLGGHADWKDARSASDETALMGAEEVRWLAEVGFEVGSQTVTHRYLVYLRPEDQEDEIKVLKLMARYVRADYRRRISQAFPPSGAPRS